MQVCSEINTHYICYLADLQLHCKKPHLRGMRDGLHELVEHGLLRRVQSTSAILDPGPRCTVGVRDKMKMRAIS